MYTFMCIYIYLFNFLSIVVLVIQSRPTFCNPLDCGPPGSPVHEISPGRHTGVGCHFLLHSLHTPIRNLKQNTTSIWALGSSKDHLLTGSYCMESDTVSSPSFLLLSQLLHTYPRPPHSTQPWLSINLTFMLLLRTFVNSLISPLPASRHQILLPKAPC